MKKSNKLVEFHPFVGTTLSKIYSLPSKLGIVFKAAREFIQYRKQLQIVDLFGTIDYDETYDYKKQRQQR